MKLVICLLCIVACCYSQRIGGLQKKSYLKEHSSDNANDIQEEHRVKRAVAKSPKKRQRPRLRNIPISDENNQLLTNLRKIVQATENVRGMSKLICDRVDAARKFYEKKCIRCQKICQKRGKQRICMGCRKGVCRLYRKIIKEGCFMSKKGKQDVSRRAKDMKWLAQAFFYASKFKKV